MIRVIDAATRDRGGRAWTWIIAPLQLEVDRKVTEGLGNHFRAGAQKDVALLIEPGKTF
jgi:hypothetical protein